MILNKFPLISIIIPIYNRAGTISQALISVFDQTFENFEVIIIDDGSTDNIADILKNFADPRLRFLKHSFNRGAAAARNTGVKAAQGVWVAFLDSDDAWVPQKLETQMHHLNESIRTKSNIMASFTGFFLHKKENQTEERTFKKMDDWKTYFLNGCFISPGSTLMVKKSVFQDVGLFDTSLKRFEDWDWLVRFSEKFEITICEQSLSHIFQNTFPSSQDVYDSIFKLRKIYRKRLNQREKLIFLSACHRELGYGYFNQNFAKGVWHTLVSIIMNPCALKKVARFLIKKIKN